MSGPDPARATLAQMVIDALALAEEQGSFLVAALLSTCLEEIIKDTVSIPAVQTTTIQ